MRKITNDMRTKFLLIYCQYVLLYYEVRLHDKQLLTYTTYVLVIIDNSGHNYRKLLHDISGVFEM